METLRYVCLRQGSRPLNRRPRLPRRLQILAGPGTTHGLCVLEVAQKRLPCFREDGPALPLSSQWRPRRS